MKKLVITFIAMLALASTAFSANQVRISQVYGGGGGSGFYLNDYVEIFNFGGTSVNLGGWTIEYGSATGNWGSSAGNIFTFPANAVIEPCKYILVQLGPAGASGAPLPVTADYSNTTTSMSQSTGKVGLFNAINSNVACGSEAAGTVVDKLAFGPTATCSETSPTAVTTNTQGVVRNGGGTVDTDNNSADFTITASPVPHNSQSPANTQCLATPAGRSTWGQVKTLYR
jgi:hypothetical protein